jgi:hypothetical protein
MDEQLRNCTDPQTQTVPTMRMTASVILRLQHVIFLEPQMRWLRQKTNERRDRSLEYPPTDTRDGGFAASMGFTIYGARRSTSRRFHIRVTVRRSGRALAIRIAAIGGRDGVVEFGVNRRLEIDDSTSEPASSIATT